jgi:hypothetical protein
VLFLSLRSNEGQEGRKREREVKEEVKNRFNLNKAKKIELAWKSCKNP